jgi:hypothetical protein
VVSLGKFHKQEQETFDNEPLTDMGTWRIEEKGVFG